MFFSDFIDTHDNQHKRNQTCKYPGRNQKDIDKRILVLDRLGSHVGLVAFIIVLVLKPCAVGLGKHSAHVGPKAAGTVKRVLLIDGSRL